MLRACAVSLVALSAVGMARADVPAPRNTPAPTPQDIQIEPRPGSKVPGSLAFTNQRGETVKLGDYLDGKQPVVVVLAYYTCPLLCTLVLNGLTDGIKGVPWNVGTDFRVLTVSIDPRDTVETAAAKRVNHLQAYGRDVPGNGWDFLLSHDGNVHALADALGFHYAWDAESSQYIHGAAAFVLAADGTLSQTLYGSTFHPQDLRFSLVEASDGRLGGFLERLGLLAFHYDRFERRYLPDLGRIIVATGVVTLLLLAFVLWRVRGKMSLA